MTRIAIGVCTFRRPGLAETLASLSALDWPEGLRGEIIVADNDETPSAEALVARYAETAPLPVQYIHAPARNISIARNAVLETAAERDMALLAFLDDDETVAPNWIAALWAARLQTGAEAVLGPVRAHHAPDAPGWMREGAIHDTRPVFLPGGGIKSGYTCNVLLDLAAPAVAGLRFDPARGRSGGEDTAFFEAMLRQGGRLGYAAEAWASETVPPDRARLSWLLKRRFRMGQTHASLIAEGAGYARRLKLAGIALAKAVFCGFSALSRPFNPLLRNTSLLRGALHTGTMAALLGARSISIYGQTDHFTPAPAAKSRRRFFPRSPF
ncbi:glycosyltransferase [Cereibacter changlensis]|uniref:Glycosyltransferase n=1 Tax=Cereibacter changlensis TaxID=402884 RepID=A0A4U0YTR3_9RHOB|nr:glycosyltransferase [Cereibacter changlensis]TKA95008.1 glycosyltransferase [Cereibacter changlensis]